MYDYSSSHVSDPLQDYIIIVARHILVKNCQIVYAATCAVIGFERDFEN